MRALLYAIQSSPEGAILHMTRQAPPDAIIVAAPSPATRATLLAYHEILLMAARLRYPEPSLLQVPPANPPLAARQVYNAVRGYEEIHALINAPPSISIPVYTALLIHATISNARITIALATGDQNKPYTSINLDPITTILTGKRLRGAKAQLAQLLIEQGRTTPTRAAQQLGITTTTAEKYLKWLRNRQLAQRTHGNIYTPTPWLHLYQETRRTGKKTQR